MTVEDAYGAPLTRVAAYEGLPVDAALWNDAHMHHETALQIHARVAHGRGIARGLHVGPSAPPGRAVILGPGLAFDGDGRAIRVPTPRRIEIDQGAAGPWRIAIRYAEDPQAGHTPPVRLADSFEVTQGTVVSADAIEVARVVLPERTAEVRTARQPSNPVPGEIDLRHRRELRPLSVDALSIGQLAPPGGAELLHRDGLYNLIRELRAGAPFVVELVSDVRAEQAAGTCHLLYLSGAGEFRLGPREATGLLAFLRGGGVLFAEPCVAEETRRQENGRFIASLTRLLADIKMPLEHVGAQHPVLSARYIFGLMPEGVGGTAPLLVHGDTIIVNPNDYGCCLQGGAPGKPLSREHIRAATELVVNVAWHTAARLNDPAMGPAVKR